MQMLLSSTVISAQEVGRITFQRDLAALPVCQHEQSLLCRKLSFWRRTPVVTAGEMTAGLLSALFPACANASLSAQV